MIGTSIYLRLKVAQNRRSPYHRLGSWDDLYALYNGPPTQID